MALFDETMTPEIGAGVALTAAMILLPRVAPNVGGPLRSIVKAGLTLFLESETELDGELINSLVETTMKELTSALSGPGPEDEKQQAAHATIRHFKHKARTRARQWGWDDADRSTRYHRHLRKLHRAVAHKRDRSSGPTARALDNVAGTITEDW